MNIDQMTDEDILKADVDSIFGLEEEEYKEDASNDENDVEEEEHSLEESDENNDGVEEEEQEEDTDTDTEEEENKEEDTLEDSDNKDSKESGDDDDDDSNDNADNVSNEIADVVSKLMEEGLKVGKNNITIGSADELTTLLQRGLGANKRMQELKPQLKLAATVSEYGLDQQDKLDFAISLLEGNKAAIAKLLKDNNIDPIDFDLDIDSTYERKDRTIDENKFRLQEVLSEVSDSDKYTDAIDFIKTLDTKSKNVIGSEPELIKGLVSDMETTINNENVFETIQNIVVKEQALGRLEGLSFIEAYNKVTDMIRENLVGSTGEYEAGYDDDVVSYFGRGKVKSAPHKANRNATVSRKGSKNETALSGNNDNHALKAAKKAANAGVKSSKRSNNKKLIDINNLSDEEILKLPVDIFG